jgi:hypothetical protein
MRARISLASSVLLIASITIFGQNVVNAEGKSENNQISSNGLQDWKPNQDQKGFWSHSNIVVGTDDDQARLDAQSPSIPGISVTPAKVFGIRPNNSATLTTSAGSGNLVNHGGALMPNIKLYAIYWGSASNLTQTYISNTNNFLQGLTCNSSSCTGLSALVSQYFPTKASIAWGGYLALDTSATPLSNPSTSSIANEVVKAAGTSLDPNGLYLVFTDNYPSSVNYCAWHSAGVATISGKKYPFTFGYMPNLTNISGCSASYLPGYVASKVGLGFDSLFNVTTHEIYETMSDPMTRGYGWYDLKGYEIGDKCAWNWATTISQNWLGSSVSFRIQQEYSNITKTCTSS